MNPVNISDAQLMDYLAGRLDDSTSARITGMISSDPQLGRRVRQLKATWEILGQWQVKPATVDLTAGVFEKLGKKPPVARTGVLKIFAGWDFRQIAKMAAMWAIAIGLGIAAAVWFSSASAPVDLVNPELYGGNMTSEELEENTVKMLNLDTASDDLGLLIEDEELFPSDEEIGG